MNHNGKNKKHLMAVLGKHRHIVVFDTETSGLDAAKDTIIQFSGILAEIYQENGIFKYRELDVLDQYIKPAVPISAKIEQITSITNAFLDDKPSEAEAFQKIKDFMGKSPIICGYNINFDIRMTSALYERNSEEFLYEDALDVLAFAKDLVSKTDLKEATGKDAFKQEAVATIYGLNEGVSFHLAIEDTRVTLKLLVTFLNEYMAEKEVTKRRVQIKRVAYKEGFSHDRSGIYAMNKDCPCFYALKYKQWYPTKKENYEAFQLIDLDALEEDCLRMTGCATMDEFAKYRGDTSVRMESGNIVPVKVSGVGKWEKYGYRRIYVKAMDERGRWFNTYYDIAGGQWNSAPFSADALEELVLKEKNAHDMPGLAKEL